ncbi:MAG: excinuclease ABC subunit UvrB, partial [Planctomycetota bacterium]|nr:excinuclease ABC subunit UvrB [Planctomycetota bacterium]
MNPKGDQPKAIKELLDGFRQGASFQVLLGVTGSGKTFTIAHVIEALQLPTLVISHNKTLAAQLYSEFKSFFPHNRVEYFVSYYDYYQPEAYIPQKDIYIAKDASINEDLDRLRLSATNAVLTRKDVIVVASVSCIYNIGSPDEYAGMVFPLETGSQIDRDSFLKSLVKLQYERNDVELRRGRFRVRGDVVELCPSYLDVALRIEFFDGGVEKLEEFNPLTGERIRGLERTDVYPAKHFILPEDKLQRAILSIREELEERVKWFKEQGKDVEAARLKARTMYDLEMLSEVGYCAGIENYSRHLSGRPAGSRPYCLLDYFQNDFLVIVDESHQTIPQIRGMYNGDRSRKETLVEHGFRLPSALDNRPLKFSEFERLVKKAIFVSATPDEWEVKKSQGRVVEQVIRPTGLVDPEIKIHPTKDQIPHLISEIEKRVARNERVLVTTLTKKLAEDLAQHFEEEGIRCMYLHSEVETFDRVEILKRLRKGDYSVVVGVNLLREGLDLPEVSLVAILDADKEGFLRSETSLIQTIGRCARNVNGEVILYADEVTKSMKKAVAETERRRKLQLEYNKKHGIKPETIKKAIKEGIEQYVSSQKLAREIVGVDEDDFARVETIRELEDKMYEAARELNFELAAKLRDEILKLSPQ